MPCLDGFLQQQQQGTAAVECTTLPLLHDSRATHFAALLTFIMKVVALTYRTRKPSPYQLDADLLARLQVGACPRHAGMTTVQSKCDKLRPACCVDWIGPARRVQPCLPKKISPKLPPPSFRPKRYLPAMSMSRAIV
jgi:hypothetical protein